MDGVERLNEPTIERQAVVLDEREWVAGLWRYIDPNHLKPGLRISGTSTAGAAEKVKEPHHRAPPSTHTSPVASRYVTRSFS